jgi:peptidoglycan/LPS O-acetylase OafA/YrhL
MWPQSGTGAKCRGCGRMKVKPASLTSNGFVPFIGLSNVPAKPANQPTSQPANQPTSQPANQPTSQRPITEGPRSSGLDLIRALAIVLVLIAHGAVFTPGATSETTGWISGIFGVEFFFSLSGFLIGSILVRFEKSWSSNKSLLIFLSRRWMRTFPLYFLILGSLLVVQKPNPADDVPVWKFLFFGQNLWTDYPPSNWFGPSWSLAIEEWSYLVFALLLFVLSVLRVRNKVLWSASLLVLYGFLIRLSIPITNFDNSIRRSVPARADAIAYGVILAVVFARRGEKLKILSRRVLPLAVVTAGLCGWVIAHPNMQTNLAVRALVFPMMALATCAAIPFFLDFRVPKLLALPVHLIARDSYAIYLVHWPVLAFTMKYVNSKFGWLIYLGLTAVASLVLSAVVERPVMKLRPRQQ